MFQDGSYRAAEESTSLARGVCVPRRLSGRTPTHRQSRPPSDGKPSQRRRHQPAARSREVRAATELGLHEAICTQALPIPRDLPCSQLSNSAQTDVDFRQAEVHRSRIASVQASSEKIDSKRDALLERLNPTGRIANSIRFPSNGFTHFLTLFSKFFSSFPHGTCSLSVSCQYLALDGVYHPLWAAIPNNPTLRRQ